MIERSRRSPTADAPPSRARFERGRRHAFAASGVVLATVSAFGWLLLAPPDLAVIRVGGVSLAWWAMCAAYVLAWLLLGTRRDNPVATDPGA